MCLPKIVPMVIRVNEYRGGTRRTYRIRYNQGPDRNPPSTCKMLLRRNRPMNIERLPVMLNTTRTIAQCSQTSVLGLSASSIVVC